MDNSLRSLDTSYGGYLNLAISGGSLTLTVAQASNPVILLTGTLGSDQYIYFPAIAGRRLILPGATGPHCVYIRSVSDTAHGVYFWTAFGIPYGIVVTPARVYWDYGAVNPGTIADVPVGWIGNGWLPCDGRWVDQGLHDILYDVVGGTWGISGNAFKLPDYRGTVLAMADQVGTLPPSGPWAVNEGNRGILNNWGPNTFAGEANHQISVAEMPGHNHPGSYDAGHGHPNSSQAPHQHGFTGTAGGGVGPYGPPVPIIDQGTYYTDWQQPAITVATGAANIVVGAQGSWVAHNNVQPTTTTIKMIKW